MCVLSLGRVLDHFLIVHYEDANLCIGEWQSH